MAGTYQITENKTDAVKFRAMVSFNGNTAEYWEHDSLNAEDIEKALQTTADNAAVSAAAAAVIEVDANGKIVIPDAVQSEEIA